MGCWNGTCAISNLPIVEYDKIVLIPLMSTGTYTDGLTYNPTDKFVPLSLPIYGEYNDYGGIMKIETLEKNKSFFENTKFYKIAEEAELTNKMLLEAFSKMRFKTTGEIITRTIDVYQKDEINYTSYENLEEFLNDFIYNEGFLIQTKTWNSDFSNTNYIMIHRELFDVLINEVGSRVPYGQEKPLKELWKEKIRKELGKKKKIESIKDEEERDFALWSYRMESMAKRLGLVELSTEAFFYNYVLNSLSEELDEELLDEFVNIILLTNALAGLRKGYLTYTGLGSQRNEIYLHTLVADFIKKYADDKIKKYDEEWIREDDFTEKDFLSETVYWWDHKDEEFELDDENDDI